MTVKELIENLSILPDDTEIMVEVKYEGSDLRAKAEDSYLTRTKTGQRYTLVGYE